jgi:two-component system sensor histidine kinase VicK
MSKKETSQYEILRAIGNLSSYGIFVYDIDAHKFVFFNAAFAQCFRVDQTQLLQDPTLILHRLQEVDQSYISQRYNHLLEHGAIEQLQIAVKQNNGEKILSCDAYFEKERKTVIGFVRDITTIREHEDYLVNFGARKDALLDMVAQNLSTPLNLSRFTVDLIDRAIKEKKYHKLNAHVKLIREVTSECMRIIDKFLQEEHLESPEVGVKKHRFDAMSKISVVLERLREANPDKQFRVTSDAEPLYINSDALKFFQIVHNVYSNAIKFTKPNGQIDTHVAEIEGAVVITISDNGIGIPSDIRSFIFERKTRAARPGLKGEISNGIGLYVVKTLTEMLNGTISFESAENQGTTFTLRIPRD